MSTNRESRGGLLGLLGLGMVVCCGPNRRTDGRPLLLPDRLPSEPAKTAAAHRQFISAVALPPSPSGSRLPGHPFRAVEDGPHLARRNSRTRGAAGVPSSQAAAQTDPGAVVFVIGNLRARASVEKVLDHRGPVGLKREVQPCGVR